MRTEKYVDTDIAKHSLSVALYRPEIPQNTGNIGRLCVGAGASLYIVGEPVFSIDDKDVKRAGLDYWDKLMFRHYKDEQSFFEQNKGRRVVAVTKFGENNIFDFQFQSSDVLMFGGETKGISDELYERCRADSVYIPLSGGIRCYNLANSAALVLFQAIRCVVYDKRKIDEENSCATEARLNPQI